MHTHACMHACTHAHTHARMHAHTHMRVREREMGTKGGREGECVHDMCVCGVCVVVGGRAV